ncbi:MAG: hypothetical protein OEW91_15085, partial [Acidimicrobiia bacterium]|nr:hypothetical protein [Acidimicrobiia bacterium]
LPHRHSYRGFDLQGWDPAASLAASLEALMGTKDKGGKSSKKPAAKNLKEKRLEKKGKRDAAVKSSKII